MTITPSTWTSADIAAKVRRITGTPSQNQLSDASIYDYINKYYTYTMPFELKEQVNLQPYNFTTQANVDVYPVLGAFQTEEPMAYANGYPLVFYQDRDIFYQDWPQQYTQDQVGTGTGAQTAFPGTTLAAPVIAGSFFITDGTQILSDIGQSVSNEQLAIGNGILLTFSSTLNFFPIQSGTLEITDNVEVFLDNGNGTLTGSAGGTGTINYTTGAYSVTFSVAPLNGQQIVANYSLPNTSGILSGNGSGTINYVTGVFTATFSTAPATGLLIYNNYQAYQPARPQGVLFYNNEFTFRPIPDQVYQITMQGFVATTQLSTPASTPIFTEWGELIAIGASLDIFLDRGDLVAYNNLMPMFKRYENVALGRYIENFTNAQSVPRF